MVAVTFSEHCFPAIVTGWSAITRLNRIYSPSLTVVSAALDACRIVAEPNGILLAGDIPTNDGLSSGDFLHVFLFQIVKFCFVNHG